MSDSQKLDLILSKLSENDKKFEETDKKLVEIGKKLTEVDKKLTEADRKITETDKKITETDKKLTEVDKKLTETDKKITETDKKLDKLENDVTDIKLTLENEIRTSIVRVAEGHLDLSRKLSEGTRIDDEKEMIAIRVSMLETEMRRLRQQLSQMAG